MPPSECVVVSKCVSSMALLFFGGGAGRGGQEFDLVSRFFTRVFLSVWRIWSVSESFSAALMCGVCRQPCSLQGESVA